MPVIYLIHVTKVINKIFINILSYILSTNHPMNPTQQATIHQTIKLLQSLLTGTQPSNPQPTDIAIPQYDSLIDTLIQKAKTLQPEIQQLTNIFIKASTTMKSIVAYSQVCRKYTPAQEQKLKNIFFTLSNDIEAIMKSNPTFIDHCKAVKQILSTTFWVFVPTPEFIIKGAIEGADFNALKFQKKKIVEHNAWWAVLTGACKVLEKFVVKNYAMGISFNGKGEDKWEQLITGQKVESNKQPGDQHKQPTQQKPKPIDTPKAPKPPTKQLIGMTWQIRNFKDQKITLSTKQVQMKHGLFIQNCTNCQIVIDAKFKSLQLNKCEGIVLTVKSCVSGVEVMNSKGLQVVIKEKTPSVSVDKCEKVSLVLNEASVAETDIVSCKASELNVTIQKPNGQDSKPHLISDQLITKFNPKTSKFQTKVYDKFL